MINSVYKQNEQLSATLIGALLVFMLNPLIGILLTAIQAISKNRLDLIKVLIVLLILYLSALNTTKTPDSDMWEYINMFLQVPKAGFMKTLGYLSNSDSPKDVVYSGSVYLLYYLLLGNEYLFIFLVSSLSYAFIFAAIYKFGKRYKLPIFLIVAQVMTLAFFTQYFSLSFHLTRQELATSLFFYALTFKEYSLKKFLIWSAIAAMVHSTILVIIMLSLIPFMGRHLNKKEILILVAFAASFIALFSALGDFILSRVALSGEALANASRMAEMEGARDVTEGNDFITNAISIMIALITIYDITRKKKMIYPIVVNLGFVWSLLIISLAPSPILQYRFFFIEYSFLPFLLFLPFKANKTFLRLSTTVVVVFLIVYFYATLNKVFHYVPEIEAILDPFPILIKLA